MLLQIEVKPKMLGRSVTFEPKSVEKHFQQQSFFELRTPSMQVAHCPPLIVCYMAFEIKGQKKAAAAFKGVWPLFDL